MAISTMYPAKAGSPKTTLAAELSAVATSMTLDDATVLPDPPNLAVIGDDYTAEIVSYTTITGNVVSGLVRGLGDTTASVWSDGTNVARNYTSFDHDRFIENIQDLDTNKIDGVAWGDITGDLETQTDLNDILVAKAPLASPALSGTPTAPTAAEGTNTTQIASTAYVMKQEPFHVTGNASAGPSVTLTDSRIDNEHFEVDKVSFGTPSNVWSDMSWSTNIVNNTVTITATFSGSTTVDVKMIYVQ